MPASRNRWCANRRRQRDNRGASAVEFALILLPLMTLLLGMIQYSWYFYTAQSASSASREAARRLIVGDCQTAGAAQTYARRQANVMSLTLTYGAPASTGPTDISSPGVMPDVGSPVRVVVRADGKVIGFLPMPDGGQVTRAVDSLVEDDDEGAPCP